MSRKLWLATALGMALVLVDRLLILASSGHLMFDVNQAEYGFLGAIVNWLEVPLWQILTVRDQRYRFFHDCIGVGNQVHGSLGIGGLVTLMTVKLTGIPLSTSLIRGLGLAQSMLALLLWCRALGASTRSSRVVLAFCLLWALAPAAPLKISMLWWGTHDTVTLLVSAWAALLLPWMAHPAPPGKNLLRAVAVGAAGGAMTLCNYSLLMPALGGLGFWAGAALLRGVAQRDRDQLLAALAGAALAACSYVLVVQWILSTGFLNGLGYPQGLNSQHYLFLSGKSGQPFLHSVSSGWSDLARWQADLWPVALRQAPGTGYGLHAALAEATVRAGILVLSVGLAARWLWGLTSPKEHGRAEAWLGIYLILAVIGVGMLSLSTTPDANGGGSSPQPRYFAHLYPFAMAVLAVGCAAPGRWLRPLLLIWPLWLGLFDHSRLIDPHLVRDRLLNGYVVELAPLYFHHRPDRLPPPAYDAWPGASAEFLEGYAVIEGFQFRRYWRWLEPAALHNTHTIQDRLLRKVPDPLPSSPDYWEGVGAALRVIVPPTQVDRLSTVLRPVAAHREDILRGYEAGSP